MESSVEKFDLCPECHLGPSCERELDNYRYVLRKWAL